MNNWQVVSDIETLHMRASVEHLVAYSNYFGVSATSLLIPSKQFQFSIRYPASIDYHEQVGKNVECLVQEKGISISRFVNGVRSQGVPWAENTYRKMRSGKAYIHLDFLPAFSETLGVTIEDLLWSKKRKTVYSNEVAGPNIRLVRKELDMTQGQLATSVYSLEIRFHLTFLSQIELGKTVEMTGNGRTSTKTFYSRRVGEISVIIENKRG